MFEDSLQWSVALGKGGVNIRTQRHLSRSPNLHLFDSLALSDVAGDACEKAPPILAELPKREFQGNLLPAFMQTGDFYSLPIDVLPACLNIPAKCDFMNVSQVLRHEHRNLTT